MKDSNVRWIGKMPSDWMITKLGSHFKCRNVKVDDISYPSLSVTKMGILPQMDSVAKSDTNDNRKQVLSGDFVINSRSDRKQSCGVSELTGSVSLINTVLYQPNQDYDNGYVSFLLKNYGFAEEFYRWGHGIVADLWTTRWQEMKDIDLPFPPMNVQKKIAYELQNKIKNIDSLVLNETKQIEKLEEYKKAVITKAVTKGLDSNTKMKGSGVEWIRDIPESWTIKKVKFISSAIFKGNGITKDEVVADGNIQCVRYGEIYTKYDGSFVRTFSKTNLSKISAPVYIRKGDILCSGTGELVEEIGKNVVYIGEEQCLAGSDIIVVRPFINPIFFNYALNSQLSQMQKSYGKSKLKVVHASSHDIGNVYIAIPSDGEQRKIVTYLDDKCEKIKRMIKLKELKIKELQAYKKSLIYEYVTGKKEC